MKRKKKPAALAAPPAECWIICHRCKEVISSNHAQPLEVECFGVTVRAYVCAACPPKEPQ